VAGYQVFRHQFDWRLGPLPDRHPGLGAENPDAADAKLLADSGTTDRHTHRPLDGDSPEAEAVKVLAAPIKA